MSEVLEAHQVAALSCRHSVPMLYSQKTARMQKCGQFTAFNDTPMPLVRVLETYLGSTLGVSCCTRPQSKLRE